MVRPTDHEKPEMYEDFEYDSTIVFDKTKDFGSEQARAGLWAGLDADGKATLVPEDGKLIGPVYVVYEDKCTLVTKGCDMIALRGGDGAGTASPITPGEGLVGDVKGSEKGYVKTAADTDDAAGRKQRRNQTGYAKSTGANEGDEVRVNL